MKFRHPFLHWLLIIGTLGQYAFVWLFLLARDANQLAGEERISIKKHARIFGFLWGVYFIGFIAAALTPIESLAKSQSYGFSFMMSLAIGLIAYFFWLLFAVAKELRRGQIQRIPSNGALLGYSLLYMSSLPLLQGRMNKGPTSR
jgi:tryptophan-rich sensory protein